MAEFIQAQLDYADVVTSTTHKTLCGPRGGIILSKGHPELHDKLDNALFPAVPAGPLMHTIAAKAVAFKETLHPCILKAEMDMFDRWVANVLDENNSMEDISWQATTKRHLQEIQPHHQGRMPTT